MTALTELMIFINFRLTKIDGQLKKCLIQRQVLPHAILILQLSLTTNYTFLEDTTVITETTFTGLILPITNGLRYDEMVFGLSQDTELQQLC